MVFVVFWPAMLVGRDHAGIVRYGGATTERLNDSGHVLTRRLLKTKLLLRNQRSEGFWEIQQPQEAFLLLFNLPLNFGSNLNFHHVDASFSSCWTGDM